MPNLDQAVIVKIRGDISDLKAKLAEGKGDLGAFGDSAKKAGDSTSGIGAGFDKATTMSQRYAAQLRDTYGITDTLSRSQVSFIRSLEDQVVATRLSGQELSIYTALRKAGVEADSQAGTTIKNLITAQYAGQAAAKARATAELESQAAVKAMTASQVESVAVTASWRNGWGLFGSTLAQTTGAMGANSVAARGLAVEHAAAGAATREFRESVHALHPILAEAGINVGALTGFSSAARGGVIALGVAVTGTLIVALAKAGDEAITTKKRLDDLISGAGTGGAGKSAFAGLQEDAKKLGVTVGDLAPSMETIIKLMQDQNRIAGVIYAPGSASANAFSGDINKAGQALVSLGNYLRTDIADSSQFGQVAAGVFKSIQQAGGLTAQIYEKLREDSPATANAIARAFKGQDATSFLATLQQMPIPARQFLDLLIRMGPASQEAFDAAQKGATTVSSALDKVMVAGKELWKSLSVDPGVSVGLKAIADGMDYLAMHTDLAKTVVIAIGAGLLLAFGGPAVAAIGAVAGAAVLFADKLSGIYNWIVDLINKWNEWLQVGSKSPQPGAPQGSGASAGASPSGASSMGGGFANQAATGESSTMSFLFGPGSVLGSMGSAIVNSPYFGGPGSQAAQNDFWNSQEFGAPGEGFASGTGGVRTVPRGFKNDSYAINLTEGEQFAVAPAGQSLRALIAGSSINVAPRSMADRNFAGGTGDAPAPDVDFAITPQGGAIAAMVSKFSDTFDTLGLSLKDVKGTLSAAGNNKLNDVIRLGTVQIVGAITLAKTDTIAAIVSGDAMIAGAIASMSSTISSLASARASSDAASGGAGASSPGGGLGSLPAGTGSLGVGSPLRGANVSGGSSSGLMGGDLDKKLDKLFGNVPYSGPTSSPVAGPNYVAPSWAAPSSNKGPGFAYTNPLDPNAGIPISQGTTPAAGPPAPLSNDPNAGIPYSTGSGEYWFADGGTLLPRKGIVPPGYENDGMEARVRLSSDEQFEVTRAGSSSDDGGGQMGGSGDIHIGTVIVNNPKDGDSVIRSLSQLREKTSRGLAAQGQRR